MSPHEELITHSVHRLDEVPLQVSIKVSQPVAQTPDVKLSDRYLRGHWIKMRPGVERSGRSTLTLPLRMLTISARNTLHRRNLVFFSPELIGNTFSKLLKATGFCEFPKGSESKFAG